MDNKDILQLLKQKLPEGYLKEMSTELKRTQRSAVNRRRSSKIGYIYIIKCEQYYKIGQSVDPAKRIISFSTDNPFGITIIRIAKVLDRFKVERCLHRSFQQKRHSGEWFLLDNTDMTDLMKILSKYEIDDDTDLTDKGQELIAKVDNLNKFLTSMPEEE